MPWAIPSISSGKRSRSIRGHLDHTSNYVSIVITATPIHVELDYGGHKAHWSVTLSNGIVLFRNSLSVYKAEAWQEIKVRHIFSALNSDPVDIRLLRREAVSKGGLLSKEVRKKAWPKLLGVDVYHIPNYQGM